MKKFGLELAAAAVVIGLIAPGCSSSDGSPEAPPTAVDVPGRRDAVASEPADHAAAGSTKALQDYARTAQRQIDATFASFGGTYSKVRIRASPPRGIEYRYTYASPVDVRTAGDGIESAVPTLQTYLETVLAPEMRRSLGIERPSATWTYLNPDGSLVWSRAFEVG